MTRQEVVIKISKINRIIGEWKYRLDIGSVVTDGILSPDAIQMGEWVQEIQCYLEQNPSHHLRHQIANIGFTEQMETFVDKHRNKLSADLANSLGCYVKNMYSLQSLCSRQAVVQEGQYMGLTESLANEQVVSLLRRAINAGLLDSHYQPTPQAQTIQLRVIAFAISSICGFRHSYIHFERLWKRENGYRLSTCGIPKYKTGSYEKAKALYPEVDFSEFVPKHEVETFYTPQSKEDKRRLFNDLLKFGYIAPDTSLKTFLGIFDKEKFMQPVVWIKDQRQLAYFIQMAFGIYNKKSLWVKGVCCFRVNGSVPHKECFTTGYSAIKRVGWFDKYDVQLKSICERFTHTENAEVSCLSPGERPIHTGKNVFHSSRSEKSKRKMYNALIKGKYIAPETTFPVFAGIFDESMFKTPIRWLMSQSHLMYFVYLAFKEDNPYDLWRKCTMCFCLSDGTKPNRNSMCSNFRIIVRKGKLETFNYELKSIADLYKNNHKPTQQVDIQSIIEPNDNTHISNKI